MNPAIELYDTWYAILRYQSPRSMHYAIERLRDHLNPKKMGPLECERESTYWVGSHGDAFVSPTLRIRASQMTYRHLTGTLSDMYDASEWMPVIRFFGYRGRYGPHEMFDLWPDGSFVMRTTLWQMRSTSLTFFSKVYAAGRPHWLIEPVNTINPNGYYYSTVDETDWRTRRPYLTRDALVVDGRYRLEQENGWWKVVLDTNVPLNSHSGIELTKSNVVVEKRYRRHEQKFRNANNMRDDFALHVQREGRKTGDEAVTRFLANMRVFPPYEAHKEAV